MLSEERVVEILKEAGVLLEGHFLLTSGRHSNRYLQCAKIFRNTKYSEELCAALGEKYADAGVEVVIGPAMARCKWPMKFRARCIARISLPSATKTAK